MPRKESNTRGCLDELAEHSTEPEETGRKPWRIRAAEWSILPNRRAARSEVAVSSKRRDQYWYAVAQYGR